MPESQELGAEFFNAYVSLLAAVWTDKAEAARLAADPAAYAAEKGLPVSPGSIVRVDDTPHEGPFTPQELIGAWTAAPGVHVLRVPTTPVVSLDELADADLEAVSAGGIIDDAIDALGNILRSIGNL